MKRMSVVFLVDGLFAGFFCVHVFQGCCCMYYYLSGRRIFFLGNISRVYSNSSSIIVELQFKPA